MNSMGRVTRPPRLGSSLHEPLPSERIQGLIDKQIKMEMDQDRREARANARLRCRARDLKEAAEESCPGASITRDEASKGREGVALRPITPLELGLMYSWMADDEKSASAVQARPPSEKDDCDDSDEDEDPDEEAAQDATPTTVRPQMAVTRWWTGGAVGLQATWEASMGWFDEADTPEPDCPQHQSGSSNESASGGAQGAAVAVVRRPAGAGVENLQATLRVGGGTSASRQLGATAARNAAAPGSPAARYMEGTLDAAPKLGPHFLGAFVGGQLVGFVATKSYPPDRRAAARRPAGSEWIIDAMGTRLSYRGCNIGTALAEECMTRCKAAASKAAATTAKTHTSTHSMDGTGRPKEEGAHEEPSPAFAYRIDVVPSAVGFWQKLGFELEEPTGEQAYYAERGGDLPMVKCL